MSYQNILVPIDLSPDNESALLKAKEIQDEASGKVTLVHVVDYVPPTYIMPEIPASYASESELIDRSKILIKEMQDKTGLTNSDVIVRVGNPKKALLEIQKELEPDLTIMAKHNQKGLQRLLGSTTSAILHRSESDVLVVHEKE